VKADEERTSQVSVGYLPQQDDDQQADRSPSRALRSRPGWWLQLYPHMLIEDVHTGIMPFLRAPGTSCQVRLDPPDAGIEGLLAKAVPSSASWGAYTHRDLTEAVFDFVRDVAWMIMNDGLAFYEVVYVFGETEDQAAAFRLCYIPTYSVVPKQGALLQEVPVEVAERVGCPLTVKLPQEDIVTFQLPYYVRQGYWRMMDLLSRASRPVMPKWAMDVSAGLAKGPAYDFQNHRRDQEEVVALATRCIGWNARGLVSDAILEYYYLWRYLRFEEFKIRLRDEIVGALNTAVRRAGDRLGFAGAVVLDGFPTLDHIRTARTGLRSGSMAFKEIMDLFSEI